MTVYDEDLGVHGRPTRPLVSWPAGPCSCKPRKRICSLREVRVVRRSLEVGQTNYLYIRVRTTPPREARITPYGGTQFVYPTDWTALDGTHISATPMNANFATNAGRRQGDREVLDLISPGGRARLEQLAPVRLASVTAANDYAFASAAFTDDPIVVRRNNLAQRNLSLIHVLADTAAAFPFLAAHMLNADRSLWSS